MAELDKLMELFSRMGGCSVTQRIKKVIQPRGGYITPKNLTEISICEGIEALNPDEATHAGLVGLAVDYMTRFMLGAPAEEAFKISMMGAKLIKEEMKAQKLMAGIQGLDKNSIVNAC